MTWRTQGTGSTSKAAFRAPATLVAHQAQRLGRRRSPILLRHVLEVLANLGMLSVSLSIPSARTALILAHWVLSLVPTSVRMISRSRGSSSGRRSGRPTAPPGTGDWVLLVQNSLRAATARSSAMTMNA